MAKSAATQVPAPPVPPAPGGFWPRRGGDVLAILALAALTLAVFWKGLADPPGMIGGDSAYLYQDYYSMAAREVQAGRIPLWNPYILMGAPFHASLQPALFYPLRWPMFWMDYVHGLVLTICLHYFLGAASMYLFLRAAVGVRPAAGLIGAMSVAFGGLAMGHASHPNYFLAYPWFFGTMTCLWLAVRRSQWRWAAPAGGCVGLMLLIGAVHLLLVLNVLVWTYAIYHAGLALRDWIGDPRKGWGAVVRPLGVAGGAMVLGVLIGAVQFLPSQALSARSARKEADWGFVNMAVASPGANGLQMVAPFYFGNMRLGYWNEFSYDEMAHYTGIAILLLAAGGLMTVGRDRHLWALVVLAIVGFLLGAGDSLPVYRIFFQLLPPFRQLRNPTRIFWLTDIALASLAAVGAQRMLYGRTPRTDPDVKVARRSGRAVLVLGGMVLVVLAGALAKLHEYAQRMDGAGQAVLENEKIQRTRGDMWYPVRLEDARRAPKTIFAGDLPTWGGVAAAVASVGLLGGLALRKKPAGRWAAPAVAAVLAADLFALSFGMIMYNDQFALMRGTPSWARRLQENLGNHRYVRILGRLETSRDLGERNRGMFFGLRAMGGLGGGIVDSPERSQFIGLASQPLPMQTPSGQTVPAWDVMDRFKNLAGVKYLLVDRNVQLPLEVLHLKEAWREGNLVAYENRSCLPMAYFVEKAVQVPPDLLLRYMVKGADFDPAKVAILTAPPPVETASAGPARREANIVRAVPGLWEIQCDAEAPGQLVVCEGFDPGWRAQIDGQPATVYQTDDQIMSVAVPAGRHAVELKYAPAEFRQGAWVSVAGVAVLVACMATGFLVGPRRRVGQASPGEEDAPGKQRSQAKKPPVPR